MSRDHHHGRPILRPRRVRKARRNGTCVLCGGPVSIGQRVGLIAAGWAHVSPCILGAQRATTTPAASPAAAEPEE